jgi:hypothetical protein
VHFPPGAWSRWLLTFRFAAYGRDGIGSLERSPVVNLP